ncbi:MULTISPECIES: hypothetical protein [Aneurinibacillus]|uniref:Uncharacterized protein n=1 Tax=Aneurinibacillus thermoaerophilus TaxID=143495 RepID=A0A1G7XZK5_ANETH|nr:MULTISPECIES: hypothetical protein [Aneurinibacillus]MED0675944.1 hypothetical protein [Aneurinibacillus thermoaerophilus]MED0677781.1 hypothetical protein [Aneurinibacillus thermoaerophilus]MED0737530.1 hypothetical protein [Aneurinibacillus thermoaerophilus]MED0758101.1 hypothetical protein [Aneurinibacillus thermoaerophilus]MED0761255.1 hypothetical protein [Aneurinibacillus thermoaerophilus]
MKDQETKNQSTEQRMKQADKEKDTERAPGYGDKKLEGPNAPAT